MRGGTKTTRRYNFATGEHEEIRVYWLDRGGVFGRVEVSKEDYEKEFPDKPIGDFVGNWKKPVTSEALAVHPDQVEEAREDAKKSGVPTDFLPSGQPIFRSTAHKRAYGKAYGFHDNNSYM